MTKDSDGGEDEDEVHRDSIIADVLEDRPDAARVLLEEFGLPCYDCEVAFHERLIDGVGYLGLDVDVVVARLNACPRKGG